MKQLTPLFVLLLILLCLSSGCGSSGSDDNDDDFFNDAEVTDVVVRDPVIREGDGTVVAVEFAFDPDRVFNDGDNIKVVVKLPPGVVYRDGTAEIDGLDDNDDKVGPQFASCPDTDELFLLFDLDEFDLDEATNPPGDGDAVVTLTIDGVANTDFATIDASAGNNLPPFSCGNFFGQESAQITVTN